jgi:hypothetical protein
LWSLGQSNLWNPAFTAPPSGAGGGKGQIGGGLIFFGGGVPLYRNGNIIGGLGISGDTSCADHEIAKETRDQLNLNPAGGKTADDIVYSPPGPPSVFAHTAVSEHLQERRLRRQRVRWHLSLAASRPAAAQVRRASHPSLFEPNFHKLSRMCKG